MLYKTDPKNKTKQNPACIEFAGETKHNQLSDTVYWMVIGIKKIN